MTSVGWDPKVYGAGVEDVVDPLELVLVVVVTLVFPE
jgi:hypothetical protein